MRLSNGVARLENGIIHVGRFFGRKLEAASIALHTKREELRIEVAARQMHEANVRMDRLRGNDQVLAELRAEEIAAIQAAAEVRKQERKLRRDIARRVLNGEVPLTIVGESACSPQPSSPSSASGC